MTEKEIRSDHADELRRRAEEIASRMPEDLEAPSPEETRQRLKMHADLGIPFFLGGIHNTLSEIHLDLGNLEKAKVHAEQAVDLSRNNNERYFEAQAMITLGRVIAATDRMKFDEARELMLNPTFCGRGSAGGYSHG